VQQILDAGIKKIKIEKEWILELKIERKQNY